MHEYPYLQWQAEVHRAKLKAAYPHAANKIETSPSQGAEDVYARVSRLSVEQGLPSIHPGDALMNLITFDRTWLRPWAFYSVEDIDTRNQLLALFPDGCYIAFAGDAYCESRSESMDDHWRVLHALPGDGQNRPSVGDSLVQVQERYNVLSNMQAETYEYGIPPIYADPQVLDFDALANQVAEPAAHFPARARPGQPLAAGFFQPAPATVPPDMLRHQQDLIGPVAQFLTGLFPAIFGGNMEDVKTASGYALARDQAMGRLGLVWRRTKQFYADVMLLAVDCFRKNRPQRCRNSAARSRWLVRFARDSLDRFEREHRRSSRSRRDFPATEIAAARGVAATLRRQRSGDSARFGGAGESRLHQKCSRPHRAGDPRRRFAQQAVARNSAIADEPADRRAGARADAHDSRLAAGSTATNCNDESMQGRGTTAPISSAGTLRSPNHANSCFPSVPIDQLLDDHATEFEECKRWANSDAGQAAHMTNPAGFANVRAHAEAHLRAMQQLALTQQIANAAATAPAGKSTPKQQG